MRAGGAHTVQTATVQLCTRIPPYSAGVQKRANGKTHSLEKLMQTHSKTTHATSQPVTRSHTYNTAAVPAQPGTRAAPRALGTNEMAVRCELGPLTSWHARKEAVAGTFGSTIGLGSPASVRRTHADGGATPRSHTNSPPRMGSTHSAGGCSSPWNYKLSDNLTQKHTHLLRFAVHIPSAASDRVFCCLRLWTIDRLDHDRATSKDNSYTRRGASCGRLGCCANVFGRCCGGHGQQRPVGE